MAGPPFFSELQKCGQTHVLRWWHELSEKERAELANQLGQVDFALMQRLVQDEEYYTIDSKAHYAPPSIRRIGNVAYQRESQPETRQQEEGRPEGEEESEAEEVRVR